MDRILARLERSLSRFAPANLIVFIVAGSALVYAMSYLRPDALGLLTLDLEAVRAGEVWRLVTFLFLPWGGGGRGAFGPILTLLALWWLYTLGSALEAQWGALKFDVYYLLGALGTIAAAVFAGGATNEYLNLSLLLAFATEFPDYEILAMLVLPIRMKWLGLFSGGLLLWTFATSGLSTRAAIAVAMANYLLFFGARLIALVRGRSARAAASAGRERFAPEPRRARTCALCGRSDKDDPSLEFRVCDCQERCHGKLTEYCLPHARAH